MARHTQAAAFREFLQTLRDAEHSRDPLLIPSLLNGQAAFELRRLISLEERRSLGAFFTPHKMADALAAPLEDARGSVYLMDPACGAGDLLLAALRAAAPATSSGLAHLQLRGLDVVSSFADVAQARVMLQAKQLALTSVEVNIGTGNGLKSKDVSRASHLLLNPPFTTVQAKSDCEWASGAVNGAAAFFAQMIPHVGNGVAVRAILPDVLRSGARYKRWRAYVGKYLDVSAKTLGRFDRWTDIDVFVLSGQVERTTSRQETVDWVPVSHGPTVGDRFTISVGAVVNYRAANRGPWRPYLTAKSFPSWGEISRVERNRRFTGRSDLGPFVVIPRTSRPDEPTRARGAIVTDTRELAVDNHLLVAKPLDGARSTCGALLQVLNSDCTSHWLNEQGRCRHLTVGAVSSIPWVENE